MKLDAEHHIFILSVNVLDWRYVFFNDTNIPYQEKGVTVSPAFNNNIVFFQILQTWITKYAHKKLWVLRTDSIIWNKLNTLRLCYLLFHKIYNEVSGYEPVKII